MRFRGISMQFNQININREFLKRINAYTQSKVTQKQNSTINTANINKNLKKINNKANKGAAASFLLDNIYGMYIPVTDTLKDLLINEKRYTEYTNELKRTNLSKEERSEIESKLDLVKESIIYRTSPKYISILNNQLANRINPVVNKLEDTLREKLGINIDASSINIESIESLGLSSNNTDNFHDIFKELKTSISNIHKKILKICDMDNKYGHRPNKNLESTLDISVE